MPLTTGQVLQERYRIDALLGQGGMGAVYRGWHFNLNLPVVVKENRLHSQEAQRQFGREAGILANLKHPNLPRVIDHFFIPGQGQYLVMDYIEGEDLSQILARQGALPEAQALNWIRQVLDALEYLHSQGVIHRDVKPANVKITPQGQVFLVDFDLAKVGDPLIETTIGARGVTPGFAPLEQYGRGRTDARSDVYAVGATLYALLTGQTPPDAPKLAIGEEPLVPPRKLNPGVSPQVEAALLRAMQTRPTDRFQTASEFRAVLSGPRAAKQAPASTERSAPAVPSRRAQPAWLWGLGAALLLLVVLGLWQVLTLDTPLPPQPTLPAMSAASATSHPEPSGTATLSPSATQPPPTDTLSPPTHTPTPVTPTLTRATAPSPTITSPTTTPISVSTMTPEPIIPTSPPPTDANPGDTWVRPGDGLTMIYVQAGDFWMGSDAGESDERPPHLVHVDGFWIDRFEVTNAAFERFVSETAYRTDAERAGWGNVWQNSQWNQVDGLNWRHPNNPGESISAFMDHPVVQVSWNDAHEYCEWAGGRLPTEAEWEMAAVNARGWRYPWGNEFDASRLNAAGHSTVPVGSYPTGRSPFGAYDMAGNVWEWVNDWYQSDYYSRSPSNNPQGPATGTHRALRGGAWDPSGGDSRSADRGALSPNSRGNTVGFRCCVAARQD
jgi:formylglycine-generating enzyme required for sulfatase activity/predicted Ser/Thr protein kinase